MTTVSTYKHIGMPNGQPERSRLKAAQRHVESENLIEDGIQRVLLDFGLSLSALRLVGQEINLRKRMKLLQLFTTNLNRFLTLT